jgi:diacylglycerol kinase family enzyme
MSPPKHSVHPAMMTRRGRARVRLAAFVAVAMVVILLLIVASAVAENPDELFIAFVFLLVAACSAWLFLTSRGLGRVIGLAAFLLGLIALVFQLAIDGFLLLGLLVGVVALFGVSARYAAGRARLTPHPTPHARPGPPVRRGVLIINPNSGGGKAQRFNLSDEARERRVEPVLLGPHDDLRELATQAASNGADVIGMAGGDGSQAVVATVAMEYEVAHVCIPAGTRNHFAVDLGIDRDDVVGALDAFTEGVERRIDLAGVNGRVFVNNASLGVYAQVVQSNAYRDAKLATWRRMLPDMLGRGAAPIDLQFAVPDAGDWSDATLVIVSNNPYQLRRFGGAGTRPRLDTGRLGILAARIEGARTVAKLLTLGTVGQSRRFRGVLEWSCPEFEVRSHGLVEVGLDGEACLLTPPLRFVSLPGALRVRVSPHATGVSPAGAAVALTRANLAGLLRIAAGRTGARSQLPGPEEGQDIRAQQRKGSST